jgi:hypothetical protein
MNEQCMIIIEGVEGEDMSLVIPPISPKSPGTRSNLGTASNPMTHISLVSSIARVLCVPWQPHRDIYHVGVSV